MKKITLLLLIVLISIGALAYDFEVDGKYYYIKSAADKTVVLTYNNYASGEYSGDFVIPETVTYNDITFRVIGCDWCTFEKCDISAIHIPKGFTSFRYNYNAWVTSVFYYPNKIIKVYVPDVETWMNIDNINAFGTLYDLYVDNALVENLVIPEGIKTIAFDKFHQCNNIKTVKLANSVRKIESQAFAYCPNLEKVECNNGLVELFDNAFWEDKNLKEINIPNSVSLISQSCFYKCTSLSSITIPEGISMIYGTTFYECSQLKEISLPSTLTQIDGYAFYGCLSLIDIYVNNPTPPLCNEFIKDTYTIFDGVDKFNCKIHVPQGSVNLYKKADGWNQFFNIIENESEPPVPHKCTTPTISFDNGYLSFHSETEGAKYVYTITCTDAKSATVSEGINLNGTYDISVYAVADARCRRILYCKAERLSGIPFQNLVERYLSILIPTF